MKINSIVLQILSIRSKVPVLLQRSFEIYRNKLPLLLIIIAVHVVYFFIFQLPYFNWYRSEAFLLIFLLDYYFIIRKYNISTRNLLLFGFFVYAIGFGFSLIHKDQFAEFAGILLYGVIALLAFREIKNLRKAYTTHAKAKR